MTEDERRNRNKQNMRRRRAAQWLADVSRCPACGDVDQFQEVFCDSCTCEHIGVMSALASRMEHTGDIILLPTANGGRK